MVLAAILALPVALAAAAAVIVNWDAVKKWLKDFVTALKGLFLTTLKGIANAAATFIQTVQAGMTDVMHKLYYQEQGQWMERVTTRSIPASELPDWAKKKLGKQTGEVDISDKIEQELKLTL